MKITKRIVDEAQVDPRKDTFIWDSELRGFGLRIGRGGQKSYIIQYRSPDGRSRRYTLGPHGRLVPDEARRLAKEKLFEVATGGDPAAAKADKRAEPTFEQFTKRYLAEWAEPRKKPKSVAEDKKILEMVLLPKFRNRKITTITRQDTASVHAGMSKTPVFANRSIALLSKMMSLAEDWGLRPEGSNPCRRVEKYKEKPRRRYLNGEELARLGAALKKLENTPPPPPGKKAEEDRITPAQALLFRLLLFTGCRLNEILTLKWGEVDFKRGVLELADSKTGQKTVPLSAPALQLLKEAPRAEENPYVISAGRKNAQGQPTHVSNPAKAWDKVRTAAKLSDVHLHDLRHTFASIGAGRNLALPTIGALLGHTQAATTQRYAHLAQDPLKRAADLIAGEIQAALESTPAGEVVDMKTKRG